jgi:thiol:disulfide interchange protein DsbD
VGGSLMGVGDRFASAGGWRGAFASGVLATVVATPCTAPFMGAALGYALTQSASIAMAVMLALGFGMALPFLALSVSPALMRRMPKPGAWMERLKQGLAFPMYGTAAWLVWVLSLQAGDGALLAALAGGILVAFGLWLWETTKTASGRGRTIGRIAAVAALLGAAGLALWAARGEPPATAAATPQDERWRAFSPAKLAELREAGQPVLVNFTAAWCVTCIVNEKAVLRADAVWAAINRKGIATLKADWTRRDPAITRALAEHGRNGVPLYVLYPPAGASRAPAILPQILTEAIVLGEIAAFPDAPRRARSGP